MKCKWGGKYGGAGDDLDRQELITDYSLEYIEFFS
jgi:hypothetical protein